MGKGAKTHAAVRRRRHSAVAIAAEFLANRREGARRLAQPTGSPLMVANPESLHWEPRSA